MKINTDINIIGGMPNWELIFSFSYKSKNEPFASEPKNDYGIKTTKAINRFEKAITNTVIKFNNKESEELINALIHSEGIDKDSLLGLYWNSSYNNELLHYLNANLYFPALFSGRISLKQGEVAACLKDLREREPELMKWSDSTLQLTSSKYLTLLKKFNLMQGGVNKTIAHPYLNDKMFILFIYWLKAIETKSNLLESEWLNYCFSEKNIFLERIMQKKYSKYFQLTYSGDKLFIKTEMPYSTIYHAIK